MDGHDVNGMALSATLHCLTGCAIGEVVGVIIGTALGWSNGATVALAIVLAFIFGYSLTSLPLLRGGLALAVVVPIAFASDTLSIAVMEIVDNAIILAVPGAMEAGLGDVLFWGSLSFALFVAGLCAYPVNRWLLSARQGPHGGARDRDPRRALAAGGRRDCDRCGPLRDGRPGRAGPQLRDLSQAPIVIVSSRAALSSSASASRTAASPSSSDTTCASGPPSSRSQNASIWAISGSRPASE